MHGFIYIASPYSHSDPSVREERFKLTQRLVANASIKGYNVFSPIVYHHPTAILHKLPTDFNYWLQFNNIMQSKAIMTWVLTIDGWEASKGVDHEINFAHHLGQPWYKVDTEANII